MREELSVRIAGEAGQGLQTIGLVLCKAFTKGRRGGEQRAVEERDIAPALRDFA